MDSEYGFEISAPPLSQVLSDDEPLIASLNQERQKKKKRAMVHNSTCGDAIPTQASQSAPQKKTRLKYKAKVGEEMWDFTGSEPVMLGLIGSGEGILAAPVEDEEVTYVDGPSNHQQLLQGKAEFPKLSQAHSSTISGFTAPNVVQSQQDSSLGPAFVSGGKKFVSLKNLASTVLEMNKDKATKAAKSKKNKGKKA